MSDLFMICGVSRLAGTDRTPESSEVSLTLIMSHKFDVSAAGNITDKTINHISI